MARMGWLWLNWGRWRDRQIVPEAWIREATQTAPDICANCPGEQREYGDGFWTNDHLELLLGLPRDSFLAAGAGNICIWVCPSLDLMVVGSPGLLPMKDRNFENLLRLVVDAKVLDSRRFQNPWGLK